MLLRKSGIWGSLAVAGLLVSGSAGAGIDGSAHDFIDGTGAAANITAIGAQGLCDACHVPHTSTADNNAPLWRRAYTAADTFTPYASTTMDATMYTGPGALPDGMSKLCLSCHDGATGLDSYGAGSTFMVQNGAELNVTGVDGTNDHPIAFDMSTASADTGLHAVATVQALETSASKDYLFGAGNNRVECASCHDVHNTAGLANLLQESPATLCVACHNK